MRGFFLWILFLVCVQALSAYEERSPCPAVSCGAHGSLNSTSCSCVCNAGWYGRYCDSTDSCVYNGPVTAQVTVTQAQCNNTGGILYFVINGGVAPFHLTLNGVYLGYSPDAYITLDKRPSGNYTWTIRDKYTCNTTSYSIIPLDKIVVALNPVQETCKGANNGAVSFTASGGALGHKFKINNVTGWTTQTNHGGLAPGTYNFSVKDGDEKCFYNNQFVILGGSDLAVTVTNITSSCFAQPTGGASISVTGGSFPYQLLIDGAIIGNFSSNVFSTSVIGKGTRQIYIMDNNNCQGNQTISMPNFPELQVAVSQKHDKCNITDPGTVTLVGSGGTNSGYQYSVDNSSWNSSGFFENLAGGVRYATVADSQGCKNNPSSFTILQLIPLNFTTSASLPRCPGGMANLTIQATGASGNYTYFVNGVTYTSNIISVQSGTLVNVKVQDTSGCASSSSQVVIPDLTVLGLQYDVAASGCSQATGTLYANATGGTAPYFYSLDGNTYTNQTNYTSLVGGTYHMYVKDANECLHSETISVTLQGSLNATANVTDLLCSGQPSGAIEVLAQYGNPPYMYSFNGSNFSPYYNFVGLAAGSYSIDVQDSSLCVFRLSAVVRSPPQLTVGQTATNPMCNGDANGNIAVIAQGGSGSYFYSINGSAPQSGPSFPNLVAGVYEVAVTDLNGCKAGLTVTLTDPDPIFVTAVRTQTSWCRDTGVLSMNASGGTGSYQYSLTAGGPYSANSTIGSLGAGVYTVYARDSNMCSGNDAFDISAYMKIGGAVDLIPPSCNGTGNISFVAANYLKTKLSFSLDNITYTSAGTFTGFVPSVNYTLYVMDSSNNCPEVYPFAFSPPPEIVASASVVNATCFGRSNGEITITASGGNGTLTYSLNDGPVQASPHFDGLLPGNYKFTVSDSQCPFSSVVTIYQPSPVSLNAHTVGLGCNETNTGQILITSSGGTGPYGYSLDGYTYAANPNFTGLSNGDFTFYLKDSNNCTASSHVTLAKKSIQVSVNATVASCVAYSVITFTALPTSSFYSFLFDNETYTENVIKHVGIGNHSWEVTDGEGCWASGTVFVDQEAIGCTPPAICTTTPLGPVCSSGCLVNSTDSSCFELNECATNLHNCSKNAICTKLTKSFTCSCKIGYTGDGYVCTDINECEGMNNCSMRQACLNTEGSYECHNMTRPSASCTTNNGGCAYNVECTEDPSNYGIICGPCPDGMAGDGIICTSLCGNNHCDPTENCVTCASDCPSPCGMCGDNSCGANETCSSCYQDCGNCDLKCLEQCVNGDCVKGQCVCRDSWSGPLCADSNQDLEMQVDETASLSFSSNSLKIKLSLLAISEFTPSGGLVRSYTISDYSFSTVVDKDGLSDRFHLSTMLANGATLNITVWAVKETRVFTFANISTQYLPNSVKTSTTISDWPFMSVNNYLGVIQLSSSVDSPDTRVVSSVDEQGHLKWLKIISNGFAFYGQFLDKAVLDGFIRSIKFIRDNNANTITTVIPHFWKYADIDPNFSVLLDSKGSSSATNSSISPPPRGRGMSKSLLIIIPVTVGAVLIGAIIVCIAAPRIHLHMKIRKANNNYHYRGTRTSMEMAFEIPKDEDSSESKL